MFQLWLGFPGQQLLLARIRPLKKIFWPSFGSSGIGCGDSG
jgi:hypothetical protein